MKWIELNSFVSVLGWTLIHSLWQGFALWMMLKISRRLLPDASSSVLYSLSGSALILMVIATTGTFVYFFSSLACQPASVVHLNVFPAPAVNTDTTGTGALQNIALWIDHHLLPVFIFWIAGVMFFSIRLCRAWIVSVDLEKNAEPVTGFWSDKLAQLSVEIGVKGKVILAQCEAITTPVILGFLKPVILLPVGMLSGLTSEEIETILLHELAHVRRQDYIINIFQCCLETILFFNPFVWLISQEIRTDRELCCDDVVVRIKNPLVYAHALHRLEEQRVWSNSLGLAASGNRNYLLQRIKRIMNSEKRENSSRKSYAVLLVVGALVACSWMSVEARRTKYSDTDSVFVAADPIVIADTTIKDLNKIHSSSWKTITYESQWHPPEEFKETFDGDTTGLKRFNFDSLQTLQEPGEPMELMLSDFDSKQMFEFDTIPQSFNQERMDEFTRQFTEQFKEMKMFKNDAEQDRIIRDSQFNALRSLHEEVDRKQMQAAINYKRAQLDLDQQKIWLQQQRLNINQRRIEAEQNLQKANADLKSIDMFQKALKTQLVKDGYLGKNDNIENLEITNDEMKVNDIKIKDSDRTKYDELRRTYFKKSGNHIE